MKKDSDIPMLTRIVWVHRDMGDGFTHFESEHCACNPYQVDASINTSTSELMSLNGDYDDCIRTRTKQ